MEIKNKLIVTRGVGEGNNGGKEGEHIQRTHGQGQWGGEYFGEQELDGAGESNAGGEGDNCN